MKEIIKIRTEKIKRNSQRLSDINTLYNPYIKVVNNETIIEPITGKEYVDRTKSFYL